jgi:proteasome assembly chaperone (PAC2) family protein
MGITRRTWINYRDTSTIELKDPIAIVGSPGLRSIGKIVIDALVEKLNPQLVAELFSYGFPGLYYGASYLGAPSSAGVKVEEGNLVELPRVDLYVYKNRTQEEAQGRDIVIIRGYQAYDATNQYMVADAITKLFEELHVHRMISLGAQVIEAGVRCCVTDLDLLEEMQHYGIEKTNVDRFIGFSGLVVALARERGIKGICLFANTTQNVEDPEYPDFNAAKILLEKVGEILNLRVDTSDLERKRRIEGLEEERMEEQGEEGERIEKGRKRVKKQEEVSGYV